jgi:hypothetical protein
MGKGLRFKLRFEVQGLIQMFHVPCAGEIQVASIFPTTTPIHPIAHHNLNGCNKYKYMYLHALKCEECGGTGPECAAQIMIIIYTRRGERSSLPTG